MQSQPEQPKRRRPARTLGDWIDELVEDRLPQVEPAEQRQSHGMMDARAQQHHVEVMHSEPQRVANPPSQQSAAPKPEQKQDYQKDQHHAQQPSQPRTHPSLNDRIQAAGGGQAASAHASHTSKAQPQTPHLPGENTSGVNDSRLSALAESLKNLEQRVNAASSNGTHKQPDLQSHAQSQPYPQEASIPAAHAPKPVWETQVEPQRPASDANIETQTKPQPNKRMNLAQAVEEIRRRKSTLDQWQQEMHEPARNDGEAARLSEAVASEMSRLSQVVESLTSDLPNRQSIQKIEDDLAMLREAICQMPTAEAVKALEDGYTHLLQKIDTLRGSDIPADALDTIYSEIGDLRDSIDRLASGGSTAEMLKQMREMMSAMEADRQTHDPAMLGKILEEIHTLSARDPKEDSQKEIAAIVERLVGIEHYVQDLSNGGKENAELSSKLNEIQARIDELANTHHDMLTVDTRLGDVAQQIATMDEAIRRGGINPDTVSDIVRRLDELSGVADLERRLAERFDAVSQRIEAVASEASHNPRYMEEISRLTRQVESLAIDEPVRSIESAVESLSQRLNGLATQADNRALAEVVQGLAERVEKVAATSQPVAKLENRLEQVARSVDNLASGDGIARVVDEKLERVHARIDALVSAAETHSKVDVAGLSRQIVDLANRIDNGINVDAIEMRLGELTNRLTRSGELQAGDLAAIREEIAKLSRELQNAMEDDSRLALEKQIREMAERFEHAKASNDAGALASLEAQVAKVAARLDQMEAQPSDLGPVNKLMDRLEANFAQNQKAQVQPQFPQQNLDFIFNEIQSLRDASKMSDDKLQATLDSLNSTLTTVVDRLHRLEAEQRPASAAPVWEQAPKAPAVPPLTTPQKASQPAPTMQKQSAKLNIGKKPVEPVSETAPQAPSVAAQPEMPKVKQSFDFEAFTKGLSAAAKQDAPEWADQKMKPAVAQPEQQTEEHPQLLEPGVDPKDAKASFIAAARRAARAASDEVNPQITTATANAPKAKSKSSVLGKLLTTTADIATFGKVAKANKTKPSAASQDMNAKLTATHDALQRQASKSSGRRRAILLSLAALVMAVGAFQIYSNITSPIQQLNNPANETVIPSEATPSSEDLLPPSGGGFAKQQGALSADPLQSSDAVIELGPQDAVSQEINNVEPEASDDPALEGSQTQDMGNVEASLQNPQAGQDEMTAEETVQSPLFRMPETPGLTGEPRPLPDAIGPLKLRVAAAASDPKAAFEIASRYVSGRQVPQDLMQAAEWYAIAAESNLAPAAYRLGSFYEKGNGVSRNPEVAVKWYEFAADLGNPKAMHNLAVMGAEGALGEPDYEMAAKWFRQAADRGLTDSQFNLAVLHAKGLGVERDLSESYKWFALAAQGGDQDAISKRDQVAVALGEDALALARARTERWNPIPVDPEASEVMPPESGWEENNGDSAFALPPVEDNVSSISTIVENPAMVKKAQELLNANGMSVGAADGILGPKTREAIRTFQSQQGLQVTGRVDANLIMALGKAGI